MSCIKLCLITMFLRIFFYLIKVLYVPIKNIKKSKKKKLIESNYKI